MRTHRNTASPETPSSQPTTPNPTDNSKNLPWYLQGEWALRQQASDVGEFYVVGPHQLANRPLICKLSQSTVDYRAIGKLIVAAPRLYRFIFQEIPQLMLDTHNPSSALIELGRMVGTLRKELEVQP